MLLFIKLGFFDILDILIVAFIFYQIYRLVKGTVAINIFAGIFTFYVAWLLVRALNMDADHLHYGAVFRYGNDRPADRFSTGSPPVFIAGG